MIHFSREKWSHVLCDECATDVVNGTYTRVSDLVNLEARNRPLGPLYNDSQRLCHYKKSLPKLKDGPLKPFDWKDIETNISKKMSVLEKKWKWHMELLMSLDKINDK